MNITDAPEHEGEVPEEEDILGVLIKLQGNLGERYKDIECKSGVGYSIVLNSGAFHLDHPNHQAMIKDLMWRVIEELAEAEEAACLKGVKSPHHLEELIDALSFLLELMYYTECTGYSYAPSSDIAYNYSLETFLGLVGNTLKNKPWKQSPVRTDVKLFYFYLHLAYNRLIQDFKDIGISYQEVFKLYTKKHHVNNWRIDTNY